ncbi:YadA-like family protein [Burkholderia diffusa]|uniref:YadA-like family protein n=1 Tax=Burkholderia diffusa TaxID=488732 RepID=UPI002ABE9683|nr:YadA-like family protein [Burkholderia diffusa]
MNKTYRSIWNTATNTWTAVAETAKSHSQGASRATRTAMIAIALGGVTMGDAMADVCTTSDGSPGTVDAAGTCKPAGSDQGGIRAQVGTRAAIEDTYLQVRGTTTAAKGEGTRSIAIGDGAIARATGGDGGQTNIAIGAKANTAGGFGQIAFGDGASVTEQPAGGAIAIGRGTTVSARGVALGDGAEMRGHYSVALGDRSVASEDYTVSVGSETVKRRITNLAKGTADTDAVNVGQMNAGLSTTTTAIADVKTGLSTTNTQITAIDGRTTANEASIKQLDGDMTTAKNNIAMQTSDISTITKRLDNLSTGTTGLVQQAKAGDDLKVGADTDGAAVNFAGTAGGRKLTGIAAGDVSALSTDAVNGSQLHGVAGSVAAAIGGDSKANADGTISAPSFTIGDGKGGTTTVNTLSDAVSNLDGRTTVNEGDLKHLADRIGIGTIGVVQLDQTTGMIAVGANSGGSVVNFAGTGGTRTLSGIANGVNDDEAVTIAQLRATGLIDYTGKEVGAVTYDSGLSFDSVTFAGALGTTLRGVAAGEVSANSMEAINGSQLFGLQEQFAKQFGELSVRVDDLSDRVTDRENIPGTGGSGTGGPGTGGDGSTVNGMGSSASGENSSAMGQGSDSSGGNSSAIGQGSVASGGNGTAVGQGSVASGENSTVIGQGSTATGSGSVALGQGSVANRDNTVSVGSVGNERQITNVADGTAPTDAINKRQLDGAMQSIDQRFGDTNRMINDVAKNAYAGIAAAMAMPNMTPSQPGKTVVAVGAANFKNGSAVAAGATYRSRNGNWLMNGAVSITSVGDAGVRAQVGYEF